MSTMISNMALHEDVFMSQPSGFIDQQLLTHVCKSKKAIYGLKKAPCAWYQEFKQFLFATDFTDSQTDTSPFVLTTMRLIMFFLVYIVDLIIIGTELNCIHQFITKLVPRFSIKDLGSLSYFLDVEVIPTDDGILLSQHKYINDRMEKAKMPNAKTITQQCLWFTRRYFIIAHPSQMLPHIVQLKAALQYLIPYKTGSCIRSQ